MNMKKLALFVLFIPSILIAEPLTELNLTGYIDKNNDKETLYFDIEVEAQNIIYELRGATNSNQGTIWSDIDFSHISVTREIFSDEGLVFSKRFENQGTMYVYLKDRQIKEGMILAGVPVSGQFTQGYFIDDGVWIGSLSINNTKCSGTMDYNLMNGRYNAKNCMFGDCSVTSSQEGKCFINYDTVNFNPFVELNEYTVTMRFKDLIIEGRINFTDTIVTDPKGVSSVQGTRGHYACKIRKANGSPFIVPRVVDKKAISYGEAGITDDTIRNFFVFLQLFSYDMFAE